MPCCRYHWELCTHIHIKPHVAQPKPPEPPAAPEAAAAVEVAAPQAPASTGKGAKPVTPPKSTAPPGKTAEVVQAAPLALEPEPVPEPIRCLVLPDGSRFDVMRDHLEVLKARARSLAAEEDAVQHCANVVAPHVADVTPAAAPAAAAPAVVAAPVKKEAGKKGQAGAQQLQEAAPTPPQAPSPAPPAPPEVQPSIESSPLSLAGRPHCAAMDLREAALRDMLEQVQVGLLKEMVEFAARTGSAAEQWAEERETSITEQLDAHLRAHRPRAGRIEEETRLARSVELVGQRRRIEGHMREQSKAVKAQAAEFEEWVSDLDAATSKQVAKLRGYDVFLSQALSARSIDIRKREAEALRQRIERDLAAKLLHLAGQVESSCTRIQATNKTFSNTELRTFEQGGQYNSSNVEQYKASLGAMDDHMRAAQARQLSRLEELKTTLLAQADEALSYVLGLIPSHHEDMALIEQLDQLLEAARRKARNDLGRNAEASAAIDTELEKLEKVLNAATASLAAAASGKAASEEAASRSALAKFDTQSSGTSSCGLLEVLPPRTPRVTMAPSTGMLTGGATPGGRTSRAQSMTGQPPVLQPRNSSGASRVATAVGDGAAGPSSSASRPSALSQCNAILSCMDRLRGLLCRQAKALDFLRSTSLVTEPLDLSLDAAPDASSEPAAGARMSAGATFENDSGGVAFRPGQRGDSASKRTAATPKAAPPSARSPSPTAGAAGTDGNGPEDVISLAQDIQRVINTCKQETEAAARAYYQMLFPEPTKGGKGGVKPPPSPNTAKPSTPSKGAAGKGRPVTPQPEGPQPIRPIRYPARIPPSLEVLLAKTDEVLNALREQLKAHVEAGMKQLRSQVIRAYRLVEHAPGVAMSALAAHEILAARRAQAAAAVRYRSRQAKLLSLIDKQRSALHPSMAQPSNRAQLEALKSKEAERAAAFTELVSGYAEEGLKGIEAAGPVVRARLAHLVSVMVRLLDSFLMPDDLPPLRDDGSDDWVYSLPGRKHDKQLFRLAAANAEAEGTPVDTPAAGKDSKSGSKAAAKPGSAKGASKTAGAAAPDGSDSGQRPFGVLTWTLPGGALDLQSLGWANDPSLPQVKLAGPASQAPSMQPPPAGKPGAKPGAKGTTPTAVPTATSPSTGTHTVTALDTPCHRAGIRAYRAGMAQVETWLRGAVSGLSCELSTWVKDEALWSHTWARLLDQLEGI